MRKKNQILSIIGFFVFSCSSLKINLYHTGNKENAIHNVIIDYLHHTKPPIKTLEVFIFDENKKSYYFDIEPRDYYLWADTVGQFTIRFPTKYKIVNGYLFFWNDSTQPVTKELLEVFKKYKLIDSVGWKMAMPNHESYIDSVPLDKDFSKWERFYIVCKDSIHKYKRLKKFISRKEKRIKIENKICK